ncbi:MAG: hypothetical protein WCK98_06275 [bacterium]
MQTAKNQFNNKIILVCICVFVLAIGALKFISDRLVCLQPGWFSCSEYIFDWKGEIAPGQNLLKKYTRDFSEKQRVQDNTEFNKRVKEKEATKNFNYDQKGEINSTEMYINGIRFEAGTKTKKAHSDGKNTSLERVIIVDFTYYNNTDHETNLPEAKYLKDSSDFSHKKIYGFELKDTRGIILKEGLSKVKPGQKVRSETAFIVPVDAETLKEINFVFDWRKYYTFNLEKVPSYPLLNSTPEEYKNFTDLKNNQVYTGNKTKTATIFNYQIVEKTELNNKLILKVKITNNSPYILNFYPRPVVKVIDNLGFLHTSKSWPDTQQKEIRIDEGASIEDTITIEDAQNLSFEIDYTLVEDTDSFIYLTN